MLQSSRSLVKICCICWNHCRGVYNKTRDVLDRQPPDYRCGYYNTLHYGSITSPATQNAIWFIWMLDYWLNTIFQVYVHSVSAALDVKAKEGGRQENKGVKAKTECYVNQRDRRRLCVSGRGCRVFRSPPCPGRLPDGSPIFRSCHPSCLAPVTGLWTSALGPWKTWVTRPDVQRVNTNPSTLSKL